MAGDNAFWRDLLGHIRDRNLVTVVGPDVTVVESDGAEQTLSTLIGQRLAEDYPAVSSGMTMSEAVAAIFGEPGGRQEVLYRLYPRVNGIIRDLNAKPGGTLRDLAEITDLRLFVSTTPDSLLATALKDVRSDGRIRELIASASRPTSEQPSNEPGPATTDTVVLSLYGKAATTREYAIHEEDRLEWLRALLRDEASLPDWLMHQLRAQPMLFLGCEIPDWLGPFLLRMSSNDRLASARKQFFFVPSIDPPLNFFDTYCDTPQVQQLKGLSPTAFIAKLLSRWKDSRPPETLSPDCAMPQAPDIFISYMREDAEAARRLRDAMTDFCGNSVWMDERQIRTGQEFDSVIMTAISETQLFVPLISANTEKRQEGYVFEEWRAAADRARRIMGRSFIMPVVIDECYAGDPSKYQRMPRSFKDFHFGRAPAGEPDEELKRNLTDEIRTAREVKL